MGEFPSSGILTIATTGKVKMLRLQPLPSPPPSHVQFLTAFHFKPPTACFRLRRRTSRFPAIRFSSGDYMDHKMDSPRSSQAPTPAPACTRVENICLDCGDKGEVHLLIFCRKCRDSAVHHYCLGRSPNEDNIYWLCWDCAPKDTNTESSEESRKVGNGVNETARLATEDYLQISDGISNENEEVEKENDVGVEDVLETHKNEDLAIRNRELEQYLGVVLDRLKFVDGQKEFLKQQNEELKEKNAKLTEEVRILRDEVLSMRSPTVEDQGTKKTKSLRGRPKKHARTQSLQELYTKSLRARPKKHARQSPQELHPNDVNDAVGEAIPKRVTRSSVNHGEALVTEEAISMPDSEQGSQRRPPARKKSLPVWKKVSSSSSVMAGGGEKVAEKQCLNAGATKYKTSTWITERVSSYQSGAHPSNFQKMDRPSPCRQM